jgi:hypothetical protein
MELLTCCYGRIAGGKGQEARKLKCFSGFRWAPAGSFRLNVAETAASGNLGHGGHLLGVPPGEFPHRFAPVLAASQCRSGRRLQGPGARSTNKLGPAACLNLSFSRERVRCQ